MVITSFRNVFDNIAVTRTATIPRGVTIAADTSDNAIPFPHTSPRYENRNPASQIRSLNLESLVVDLIVDIL